VGGSTEGPRSVWFPLLEVLTFTLPVNLPHCISPLTLADSWTTRVLISLLVLVADATSSSRLLVTEYVCWRYLKKRAFASSIFTSFWLV